jgi:signal transduction histidine kinase/ActR/RegA family two-component response regulator
MRDGDGVRLVASAGDARLSPDERQVADAIERTTSITRGDLLILPLRARATAFGAMSFAAGSNLFDVSEIAFATELVDRIALLLDRARLFRDLERANRVKDEFLATLSHELRTPLNAVLGWTRMLRRGTVPSDRTSAILETIERNAAAQMQLVEELLDLSAMAAGGLRLSVTRVDLRDVVSGAVETVRPAAEAKALRVNVSIKDRLDEIAGDPARLRQVLWNILANAVKFTPAGGTIDVRVAEGPADVEITVKDDGPGIPADFLPHVFAPFRQGDPSTTRTVGGLGLGLAIARHIVEAHGGTVTARSDGPGHGSAFSVRLPTGRPPGHAEVSSGAGSLRGRRVLAVDDDESTQELVATMLLMYGVSVRTAGRAAEAIDILAEWLPDVLLTDIAMPGEDGYALMRRVRAMPAPVGSIPAVALTAFTDSQSMQNAFAAGFDAHLGKPLEPHVLADALSKVLRMKRP